MKNLLIAFAFIMACVTTSWAVDEKYSKAMEATIIQMNAAKSLTDVQAAANKFEMIGKNATTEWLPNYYAAMCYANLSFMEKDSQKRDQYVSKAEELLKNISVENDEVLVMKAYIAMANLAIDGQNRWQTQGAIFDESLKKAEKLNAENPRIYYLRATNLFYTPEPFGGGPKTACPLAKQAKAKFEAFKPTSSIAPGWGKEYNEELLSKCQ